MKPLKEVTSLERFSHVMSFACGGESSAKDGQYEPVVFLFLPSDDEKKRSSEEL